MRDDAKIQWSGKLAFLLTCPPPPSAPFRQAARARPPRASRSASAASSAFPPPGPLPVGVFARAPLPLGASVATIPKSACLTPRTSLLAPYLSASPFFQAGGEAEGEADRSEEEEEGEGGKEEEGEREEEVEGEEAEGEHNVLFEKALGAKSRWAAYFGQMPEREDVPVLWGKQEAKELLKGTEIEQAVPGDLAVMRAEWRRHIRPFLLSLPPHVLQLLPGSQFSPGTMSRDTPEPHDQQLHRQLSFDQYLAAKSLISSRAFAIDSWHGHGMVPLADLFNHRTASESVHFTINDEESDQEESDADGEESKKEGEKDSGKVKEDGGDEGEIEVSGNEAKVEKPESAGEEGIEENTTEHLEMIMVRNEGPGDEVFNTYGQLSTAALLLRYGFTEPLSFGGAKPKGGTEELPVRLGKAEPDCGEGSEVECICCLQYNPFDLVNVDLSVIIKGLRVDQSRAGKKGGKTFLGRRITRRGQESSQSSCTNFRAANTAHSNCLPPCSSRSLRWAVKLLERAGCPPLESQGERYFEISADGRPQLELLLLLRLVGLDDVAAARVDASVAEREADVDWGGLRAAELARVVGDVEGERERGGDERWEEEEEERKGGKGEGGNGTAAGRKRRNEVEERTGGGKRRMNGGGKVGRGEARWGVEQVRRGRRLRGRGKERGEEIGEERGEDMGGSGEEGGEKGGSEGEEENEKGENEREDEEEDGEEDEEEGREEEVAATRRLLELPTIRALLDRVLHARDRMYGGPPHPTWLPATTCARMYGGAELGGGVTKRIVTKSALTKGRGTLGGVARRDVARTGLWTVVDDVVAARGMEREERATGGWWGEREQQRGQQERQGERKEQQQERQREWHRLLHAMRLRVAEKGVLARCRGVWLGERCLCGRAWRVDGT
ncbi:hypothetical protein CLOP_g9318 [Closterium sp. NIES-67]|nr:hypothetical protein CLOP_g9318 [Closterium sp. NIES-67]